MKRCGILFGFCNPFSVYSTCISLSASVYSKVPKQSRVCLSIFEYKHVLKILFGGKKKHFNELCFYSVFFYC
jgi:hypothetical protein